MIFLIFDVDLMAYKSYSDMIIITKKIDKIPRDLNGCERVSKALGKITMLQLG
jgi:hypothetical protein